MPVVTRTEWSGENLILSLPEADRQVDKQTIKVTCLPLISMPLESVYHFFSISSALQPPIFCYFPLTKLRLWCLLWLVSSPPVLMGDLYINLQHRDEYEPK